jgi:hypothetical protein
MSGAVLDNYEEKMRERKKEDKTRKLEYMKSVVEREYDNVSAYHEFKLNSDGRTWRKQDLVFTNKFDVSDMVKKAGDNLLVSIPALVGSQLFLGADERKREVDAYLEFPRSLRNVVNFTIPAGYKVVGIQSLNMNVDNPAGTFAVQASLEGDKLTILAKKIYKTTTVKKEHWPGLLQMMDAAFNFSQKKILLKKI